MKRIMIFIAALVGMAAAQAQTVSDVAISDLKITKDGSIMNVDMDIDLSKVDVANRRSLHLIPILKNGADSVLLSPIGVYSRGRYINYLRRGESIFEDLGEKVYKEGQQPDVFNYQASVPYYDWMNGSELFLSKQICGCCQEPLDEESESVGGFGMPVFEPYFIYIKPEPELSKQRELSGTAFIDFVVSRTDINPDYRNNRVELAKIIATIDSVKNDKDVKVKTLHLKGFASPESPYSNNERLAKGRTAALKDYVRELYDFDTEMIETEYEPENWEGLRAFVEASTLASKQQILETIDSDLEPDTKERKIATDWPEAYRYLLYTSYPALRKTDYRIEYTIETFTDVDEIVRIFHESPSKLSLNELYIAATTFEQGSEEYIEVFETAVRMYPSDPVANLNAANIAIQAGNYVDAKYHLDKAGDSPQASYARGLYNTAIGNYDLAQEQLTEARDNGIVEASEMLDQCAALKEYHANNN